MSGEFLPGAGKILKAVPGAATLMAADAATKPVPAVPATVPAIVQQVEAPKAPDGVVQITREQQQALLASESPPAIPGVTVSPNATEAIAKEQPKAGSAPKAKGTELSQLKDFIRSLETRAPLDPISQQFIDKFVTLARTFLTHISKLVGANADFTQFDSKQLEAFYRTPLLIGLLKIVAKTAEPITPLLAAFGQVPQTIMKNGKLSMTGVREALNLVREACGAAKTALSASMGHLQKEPAQAA